MKKLNISSSFLRILILVLILVLILILFITNVSRFTNQIDSSKLYNGDKWADYRIGDVYYGNKNDNIYDSSYEYNILYHKYKYPSTIANLYINNNTIGEKNKSLMNSIIESKAKDTNSHPDTLFLHIRVGDVLCRNEFQWLENVDGKDHYSKINNIEWWNDVLNYIKSNNITRIVIISGSHKNECLDKSMDYIKDRAAFLQQNIPGLKIEYSLGKSPDEDIIMCYYVKHFISTGGGFGNLISEIKKNKEL
jgi:hypothetical protein